MVITVGANYNWSPRQIDDSYHDRIDYWGLFFWYDYVEKPKNTKKTSKK